MDQSTGHIKKFVTLFLFHFFLCRAERGEGAAFQLALFDGWFTEHGLDLFLTRRSHVHSDDGSVPTQRQQSMTGRGQIMRWRASEQRPILPLRLPDPFGPCAWLILHDVDDNQEHKDIQRYW